MVRLKQRYLLVNILYPEKEKNSKVSDLVAYNQPTTGNCTPQVLLKAIRAEVSSLFGDYGIGAIADTVQIKYLSPATSTFIIRVGRAHYRIVWAALTFMKMVPVKSGDGKKCIFRVVRVSGTMRKAEEEAIRRAKEMVTKARRELGEQSDSTLDNMFGRDRAGEDPLNDFSMVDQGDSDEDEDEDD